MQELIKTLEPFLKVFPAAEEVFAEPVNNYVRHLLPLVSVDLAAINPHWEGWIHLVNPLEPEDEVVGKDTAPFHNYYLRPNWIAFRLNDDDRYELMGDFRYFFLDNPVGSLPDAYSNEKTLQEHYAKKRASFEQTKALFEEHGQLYPDKWYRDGKRRFIEQDAKAFIDQLGGGVRAGNWAWDFPIDDSDEENIRPLSVENKPFHFIASKSGWDYSDGGPDDILLFFEPESRVVLLTFDWS